LAKAKTASTPSTRPRLGNPSLCTWHDAGQETDYPSVEKTTAKMTLMPMGQSILLLSHASFGPDRSTRGRADDFGNSLILWKISTSTGGPRRGRGPGRSWETGSPHAPAASMGPVTLPVPVALTSPVLDAPPARIPVPPYSPAGPGPHRALRRGPTHRSDLHNRWQ